jgi:hypothetical protein
MPERFIRHFIVAWKSPRWRWALLVALLSDVLGIVVVLLPPVQWLIDALTALLLLLILGFRWPLFGALIIEVIPGLEIFPAWTLVVLALSAKQKDGTGVIRNMSTKGT